jgi:hypothetical protein
MLRASKLNFGERRNDEVRICTMDELQVLWSCTLGSLPSVSNAQKRSLGDWVFWDSRIGPHPSPVHQRSGPQHLTVPYRGNNTGTFSVLKRHSFSRA